MNIRSSSAAHCDPDSLRDVEPNSLMSYTTTQSSEIFDVLKRHMCMGETRREGKEVCFGTAYWRPAAAGWLGTNNSSEAPPFMYMKHKLPAWPHAVVPSLDAVSPHHRNMPYRGHDIFLTPAARMLHRRFQALRLDDVAPTTRLNAGLPYSEK